MLKVTDFDLRLLRIFKAVTDCGGFSAAESTLDMNLSTISTHMTDLETRVGIRLCERGRRGFQLTAEGRALYQSVSTLLDCVEDFRANVGALRGQIGGELAVGIVDNTITDARMHVAEAIRAVKLRGGDLHIRLQVQSPSEIEEAVQERRLHVGIGPFRNALPGLDYKPLYREDLYLYCGRGHALFDSAPLDIALEALGSLDYVARGYMRETKEVGGPVSFKATATVHHMEAVATLILSGRFIGYLPKHYARQWADNDLMRALRPDVLSHVAEFSLVTRKDRQPTIASQMFIDALLAHAV